MAQFRTLVRPEILRSVASRTSELRESYDERLNRVLEAATEVIARLGYERASMREVARAADVSLAGLYHYFDNKEKMLFLIQFRTFSSLVSGLREKLHGISDPVEQLSVMEDKQKRSQRLQEIHQTVNEQSAEAFPDQERTISNIINTLDSKIVRQMIIEKKMRQDGRGPLDIRSITSEVNILPRTHGSALFTRGQTQALSVAATYSASAALLSRWSARSRLTKLFGCFAAR